jgi:uncharacterized repeat protein (TIGR01451 family)
MKAHSSFESTVRSTLSTFQPLKGKAMNFAASIRRVTAVSVLATSLAALAASTSMAADNTATGDIAGGASTITTSNTFTINSTTLALVKAAFLADGTPLASGTSVPKGSLVKFMIYLDNSTIVPADSVNVSDVLAAQFVYQPGTIHVDNTVNTGATAAAIYASVNATAAITDGVSNADVAGISGSTVSAGLAAGNAIVTVPAQKVFAVLFSVKVQ